MFRLDRSGYHAGMGLLAFIIALAAFIVFVVEFTRSKSLVTAGLALLTLAWIVAGTHHGGQGVTRG